MAKAATHPVDSLILDLEDAVAPAAILVPKVASAEQVRALVSSMGPRVPRNGPGSGRCSRPGARSWTRTPSPARPTG